MTATPTSAEFSATCAQWVASRAAAAVGLGSDESSLIRLGSNAIVRFPRGVVARWRATGPGPPQRNGKCRSLRRSIGPLCRVCSRGRCGSPVVVEGHPVTFWAEIRGPHQRPSPADLGTALRKLHAVDVDLGLPPLDPWDHIPERIEQAPVADQHRRVMRTVLAEVQDWWSSARFELPAGSRGSAPLC